MKNYKFSLKYKDFDLILKIVNNTDKKILALWAIDCAERVLPYFEKQFPNDNRPQIALETLKSWISTGLFKMKIIRKASLDSHAAARGIKEDNSAKSAARSAGQAVATAHVKTHSIAAANYALQAIFRASDPFKAESALAKEREWQFKRLNELKEKYSSKSSNSNI